MDQIKTSINAKHVNVALKQKNKPSKTQHEKTHTAPMHNMQWTEIWRGQNKRPHKGM